MCKYKCRSYDIMNRKSFSKITGLKMCLSYYGVLALLLFIAGASFAGVTNVLYETVGGHCKVTVSHDAVVSQPGVLIIRPLSNGEDSCSINEKQVVETLNLALEKFRARADLVPIASVFLGGRLIAYPWLSQYVIRDAQKNKKWNAGMGNPVGMTSNAYLNQVLFTGQALKPFASVLKQFHYEITGVSCEKVLINEDGLPYDAMCWLQVRSK